jgi:hypothetical protein
MCIIIDRYRSNNRYSGYQFNIIFVGYPVGYNLMPKIITEGISKPMNRAKNKTIILLGLAIPIILGGSMIFASGSLDALMICA